MIYVGVIGTSSSKKDRKVGSCNTGLKTRFSQSVKIRYDWIKTNASKWKKKDKKAKKGTVSSKDEL